VRGNSNVPRENTSQEVLMKVKSLSDAAGRLKRGERARVLGAVVGVALLLASVTLGAWQPNAYAQTTRVPDSGTVDAGPRAEGTPTPKPTPTGVPPVVTFATPLPRACAGHINNGAHIATVMAKATQKVGATTKPLADTDFTFVFDGNTGKPNVATFLDSSGNEAPSLPVHSDSNGMLSARVLSSDVVTKNIKVKAQWKDGKGNPKDVGSTACDFTIALSRRRFGIKDLNQGYAPHTGSNADKGWEWTPPLLTKSGDIITGVLYLKFRRDPSKPIVDKYFRIKNVANDNLDTNGDGEISQAEYNAAQVLDSRLPIGNPLRLDNAQGDANNWEPIPGHTVRIRIESFTNPERPGVSVARNPKIAYICDGAGNALDAHGNPQPNQDINAITMPDSVEFGRYPQVNPQHDYTSDPSGRVFVHIKAGPYIAQANLINLRVIEVTQKRP